MLVPLAPLRGEADACAHRIRSHRHSGAPQRANPESRDSGFDAAHRPGMTVRADAVRTCGGLAPQGRERNQHRIKNPPAPKVNNFLPAPIRFRFVLLLTNALWTAESHVVESPEVRLRRFRKSHHLIPAGPARSGVQPVTSARIELARLRINKDFERRRSRRHVPARRHRRFT